MTDLTGQQFGSYQLTARLGKGGMGEVYQAYQSTMDRDVAVKVLPVQIASDLEFAVRFRQEALILARLQHPHILPIFDYGEAQGCFYLVMPLIKSGTLADRMRGQVLSLPFITTVLAQVGDALDYAHAQGLIHRDIKPQNILMDARGNCLLADFGIAKLLDATTQLTHTGGVIGTPAYMSPEQGQGLPIDGRSDIYSLGVVLYQMATGRVPFESTTPLGLIYKHVNTPLPAPRTVNPNISPALERVISRALAKAPENRFATAGAMAQAMQAATASGQTAANRRPLRRATALIAAALLLVIGLGGAGLLALWFALSTVRPTPSATPAITAAPTIAELAVATPIPTVASPGVPASTIPASTPSALAPTPTVFAPSATIPAPTVRPATVAPVPGTAQQSAVDGMKLLWVAPGAFRMGSLPGDSGSRPNEYPQHRVTLDGFWIDRTEITNAQYAAFLNRLGYSDRQAGAWIHLSDGNALLTFENGVWKPKPGFDQHPAVNVSWDGADAYCRRSGRRLPTEAEWEKAARGPDGRIYPWGNAAPTGQLVNFADRSSGSSSPENDGFAHSAPVGSYLAGASPYGALDMAGNVWEWVSDWYDANYYASSPAVNPQGPATGSFRVLRGGSWNGDTSFLRAAYRGGDVPYDAVNFDFGFRCAMDGTP